MQVKELLDELEFVVVPFTNPDGYAVSYTFSTVSACDICTFGWFMRSWLQQFEIHTE